jgi:hypothetical protein
VLNDVARTILSSAHSSDGLRRKCRPLGIFWVVVDDPELGRALRLARDPEGRELLPAPVEYEPHEREKAELRIRELEEMLRRRMVPSLSPSPCLSHVPAPDSLGGSDAELRLYARLGESAPSILTAKTSLLCDRGSAR